MAAPTGLSVHDGPLPVELVHAGTELSHAAAWQEAGWAGWAARQAASAFAVQQRRHGLVRTCHGCGMQTPRQAMGQQAAAAPAAAAHTCRQVDPGLARGCAASVDLNFPIACAGVSPKA